MESGNETTSVWSFRSPTSPRWRQSPRCGAAADSGSLDLRHAVAGRPPSGKIVAVATHRLQDRCDALIRSFRQRPDASARTLLVTVFGDGVEPHGGEVWAGSLLRLVEPLGINERLVRTSLNRLVGEGFLVTRRHGKRSFYSVTPMARREVRQAERHIYHPRGDPWDGRWTVVVNTSAVAPPARAAVRQHLSRLGFSALGSVGPHHALRPDRRPAPGARRSRPRIPAGRVPRRGPAGDGPGGRRPGRAAVDRSEGPPARLAEVPAPVPPAGRRRRRDRRGATLAGERLPRPDAPDPQLPAHRAEGARAARRALARRAGWARPPTTSPPAATTRWPAPPRRISSQCARRAAPRCFPSTRSTPLATRRRGRQRPKPSPVAIHLIDSTQKNL